MRSSFRCLLAPLTAVLLAMTTFVPPASAATPRPTWVVSEIRTWNHPYAATAAGELDTKLAKMALDPYTFYRGTAHLFQRDMATWPASAYATAQTGQTWIGGDAHLGNFDAARDSSGTAVFRVSDFDEAYLGQYTWDLRRLATSLVLAGRANGVADADLRTAIGTLVGAYADKMTDFKGSSAEASFRLTKSTTTGVVDDLIAAADAKTRASLLSKYTQVSGGVRTFQTTADLVSVPATTRSALVGAMTGYVNSIATSKRYAASFYTVKDVRQKLGSGVGSLGRLRYYVLVEGASTSTADDVILEFKQEAASAVAQTVPGNLPSSAYGGHEGQRVARTAKAQVANADVLIGWTTVAGLPYWVHEKSPYQQDVDAAAFDSAGKLDTAATYFGQALASAHALADQDYDAAIVSYSIDKQVSDAITSKSGLKTEIANFAFAYADQVALDWAAFVDAYDSGVPLY